MTDEGTYEVHRRYSEFRALRDDVRRALPSESLPRLPPKKVNPLRDNFSRTFLQVSSLDQIANVLHAISRSLAVANVLHAISRSLAVANVLHVISRSLAVALPQAILVACCVAMYCMPSRFWRL